MVGPTREEATSGRGYRPLAIAFVALVAISGATVALQAKASLLVVALSTLGGVLVGLALVLYFRWAFGL
ncbi:hypothetical protein ACFQDG_05580 [Natronoarchaeum mannanilyticum]|uniref:Major facilitator superfamily (MFS) profile domain-containing protein n=1 Tax=Natronoarchaeum mannanilyticum TaxID=926360 RepID=A0AAV3TEG1_9EURY